MKITKYIFIYTVVLCMAAQGSAIAQVCIGPDHSDSAIDWASNCHTPATDDPDAHPHSMGHQDSNCIDIFISSVAGSSANPRPDHQLNLANPVILTLAECDRHFSPDTFSNRITTPFPDFADTTFLAIASTILII